MTAALSALARIGLIVTRANAVERLALATHCLADKTGTLTEGQFRLRSVSALAGGHRVALPVPRRGPSSATLPTPAASAIVAAAGGRDPATMEPGDREHATVRENLESGARETGNLAAGREADDCTPGVTHAAGRATLEVTDASAHAGGHRRSGRRCPSRGRQPAIRGRGLRTGCRRRARSRNFGTMTTTARTSTSPTRTRCSLDSFSPTRCAPMRAS